MQDLFREIYERSILTSSPFERSGEAIASVTSATGSELSHSSHTVSAASTSSMALLTRASGSRTVHFRLVLHFLAEPHAVKNNGPSMARITSSAVIWRGSRASA
jgi:hypothetical protein